MYQSLLGLLQKRKDALGNPTGWSWVIKDPVINFITPTLHILEKDGHLILSTDLRRHSEELYWNLTAFWMRREHKMKWILHQFDKEEIDVIPLKGAALLESIYKRMGVRFMSDVDLLVHDADFVKASRI
ncbi:MAG TPA: hypothetical protein DCK95_05530, partial [Anaerolineaceae bacterium]|nr:hypothetical protein [Anaerolineaceae bacterium]